MLDKEKVIKGLEICSEHGSWHGLNCELNEAFKDCPYRGCETGCIVTIAKDAIALLNEQEEEIENLKQTVQSLAKSMMEGTRLPKEQEAKPIIRKQAKKEYEDGYTEYFAEWYCPHCNQLMNRGFDTPWIKYCYNCGQPIIWEGR